jgi:hypothetical protein
MADKETKIREAQMAQLLVLQARVMYQQTVITNGLYKTRKIYHGTQELPENLLTEEELLKNEIDIMKRHITRMQHIQEDLIPSEND